MQETQPNAAISPDAITRPDVILHPGLRPVIVVHYHELWLKGGNRRFFLGKLVLALRRTLAEFPVERFGQPGDRIVIELGEGAPVEQVIARLQRVLGVAYFAVARPIERFAGRASRRGSTLSNADNAGDGGSEDSGASASTVGDADNVKKDLDALCRVAWEEVEPLAFSNFAVRAKRSDKSFPLRVDEIEIAVGRYLLDHLRAAGRNVRVQLDDPELTCRIEITPGPMLVYARKIPGCGGLPANTTGRMMCLLSGGFDSAVAAYKMMRRGAHLSYVHFWGGGARPGESSVHVARALVERLVPYQFTAKLYLVPFEAIQREIVRSAPESYRLLLYRRMMLRIAERLAYRNHAQAIVSGDSLGQVASQTLQNMVAVGAASPMPMFRPLAGDDKQDILAVARRIGTYEISAEPFHDCCPLFLPRSPALYASAAELDQAEAGLDVQQMVKQGVETAALERYKYVSGKIERAEGAASAASDAVENNSAEQFQD